MNKLIKNNCLCDNFEVINVIEGSLNDINKKDIDIIADNIEDEKDKLLILKVTDVNHVKYNYYYLYKINNDFIVSPTSDNCPLCSDEYKYWY